MLGDKKLVFSGGPGSKLLSGAAKYNNIQTNKEEIIESADLCSCRYLQSELKLHKTMKNSVIKTNQREAQSSNANNKARPRPVFRTRSFSILTFKFFFSSYR